MEAEVASTIDATGSIETRAERRLAAAPTRDRHSDRVQIIMKRAIDNGEHPAQLRQYARVLGSWRSSECIASRREQLDPLLNPRQEIADAGRDIQVLLASGEPAHEPLEQFLD